MKKLSKNEIDQLNRGAAAMNEAALSMLRLAGSFSDLEIAAKILVRQCQVDSDSGMALTDAKYLVDSGTLQFLTQEVALESLGRGRGIVRR